ncbi:MAG: lipoate--protein ligase [Clostridiales bacterium]|nr:lipoate--protein ligase [Clostridiales bacterium]
MNNRILDTFNTDPAVNLAMEEALLLQNPPVPTLFLWQNAHTVVIGRGQNAWRECRSDLLLKEGGTLVRRSTGGGAVYHDLGNLNFSFVMPGALYDVPRQLDVIRAAVARFGIAAVASGRNDIVLKDSGAKFSGNAFRHTPGASLHHGTLLMDVDVSKLGRYLQPSRAKLDAKGVQSVRARVGNLKELAPHISLPDLKTALFLAFQQEYGKADSHPIQDLVPQDQLDRLTAKYRDWDWTFGKTPPFDLTLEQRFPFGSMEIHLRLKNAQITGITCYTDANDPDLAQRLEEALMGCPFTPNAMQSRLSNSPHPENQQVGAWLGQTSL